MKRVIAILLIVFVSITAFAACGGGSGGGGGGSSAPSMSGKYSVVSFTDGGETFEMSVLEELGFEADAFYLEFVDGTKFTMVIFGESEDGTYKLEGNNLALTVDGEEVTATVEGNKITLDADGTIMVFEKK